MRTSTFAAVATTLFMLGAAQPNRAQPPAAAENSLILLDADRLDRVTAGHTWALYLDLSTTPPTVAKALVVHGGSLSNPPHSSVLVVKGPAPPLCNPTACGLITSGAANPLHWIDP